MPLFLSLILALGVCLIYLSCFPDNGKPPKPSNDPALVVALRKAGMHSLTPPNVYVGECCQRCERVGSVADSSAFAAGSAGPDWWFLWRLA